MSEHIFKEGELAFSFKFGWGKVYDLSSIGHVGFVSSLGQRTQYVTGGYASHTHPKGIKILDLYPSLLTVEQAEKLGYHPPKELLPKEELYQWRYELSSTQGWYVHNSLMKRSDAEEVFLNKKFEIHSGPYQCGEGEK